MNLSRRISLPALSLFYQNCTVRYSHNTEWYIVSHLQFKSHFFSGILFVPTCCNQQSMQPLCVYVRSIKKKLKWNWNRIWWLSILTPNTCLLLLNRIWCKKCHEPNDRTIKMLWVCAYDIYEGYQKSSFALRGYSMKKNEVMWSVKWLSAFFCIANIRCSMIVGNYRLPTSGHDPLCRTQIDCVSFKSHKTDALYPILV